MQCGKHQQITHTSSICSATIPHSFSRAGTGASVAMQSLGCSSCGCLSAGRFILAGRRGAGKSSPSLMRQSPVASIARHKSQAAADLEHSGIAMIVCYVMLQSPTFMLSMCCTAGTYSTCWASGIRHASTLKTDSSSWSRAVMDGALKSKESIGLRATTPDWTASMSLCADLYRAIAALKALGRFERQGQQSHRSAVFLWR